MARADERRLDDHMSMRLIALCFGNFVIGTGTLIVPGMLSVLAEGLGIGLPVAGQLITAFALTVCFSAPVLAAATARLDRRMLLVGVLLLFALGHAWAALVSDFGALLAARVVTAFGAALYTAQASVTAALLVPAAQRGRAIAFTFLGWSIASVVGMPAGAYIGATFGWRAGFALVSVGALMGIVALRVALPSGVQVSQIDGRIWRIFLSNPNLPLVIAVTVLQSAAQFALFSYLVPGMKSLIGATPGLISALLAVFGVLGVAGNAACGRLVDRFGASAAVMGALLTMTVGHVLWTLTAGSLPGLVAVLIFWGAGCFAVNSAQQARLVGLSPPHAPVSIAMNTSAIYLGQAIGTAAAGSTLGLASDWHSYAALPAISLPLFAAAAVVSIAAARRTVVIPR
ncbi:MAG TPA: MFS transporter [Burkholderiaceae bacterium]|nr:MFS transporter [Burkholderiaceae bacterium]